MHSELSCVWRFYVCRIGVTQIHLPNQNQVSEFVLHRGNEEEGVLFPDLKISRGFLPLKKIHENQVTKTNERKAKWTWSETCWDRTHTRRNVAFQHHGERRVPVRVECQCNHSGAPSQVDAHSQCEAQVVRFSVLRNKKKHFSRLFETFLKAIHIFKARTWPFDLLLIQPFLAYYSHFHCIRSSRGVLLILILLCKLI